MLVGVEPTLLNKFTYGVCRITSIMLLPVTQAVVIGWRKRKKIKRRDKEER
jgi:hypothetical protein